MTQSLWRSVTSFKVDVEVVSCASDQGQGSGGSGFGFRFPGSGIRDPGSGIRDPGSGIRFSGFGFRISDFGFRFSGQRFQDPGFGFRLSGSRFRDPGSGIRVSGFGVSVCTEKPSDAGKMMVIGRRVCVTVAGSVPMPFLTHAGKGMAVRCRRFPTCRENMFLTIFNNYMNR